MLSSNSEINKRENEKKEFLDILDENGIKTGEILSRKEIHKKGLWHRAIVVAIVNEENEVLIQQRSANKDKNPNMWDISAAGHLSTGQDSLSAATREISEEVTVSIGFSVEVKDFRFMFSFKKQQVFKDDFIENQFYDFFILRQNGLTADSLRFQASEVQAVKFVTVAELKEMIERKEMVERDECYNELSNYLFRF
jgi:Isopentenyldiphosphate isomerase